MSSIGNKVIFAKNLAYYIERSGRTQREMSEVVGVAASTFNDWMKAKKYPRIDKIQIMANYFGIQMSDLIEEKEKPTDEFDGLSENTRKLIAFAKTVPDDKVDMVLRVMKSILEAD